MNQSPIIAFLVWNCLSVFAHAAEVRVAVAANFAAPIKALSQPFEQSTGHTVSVAVGSTGQLYAQIKHGAPFDVFLAADDATPIKLEKEGATVSATRFTYAIGKLVLWSNKPNLVDPQGAVLHSTQIKKIAIANPKLAPYGAAAMQVLEQMGLNAKLTPKLVEAANIGQAYQFVASENADLGFVALSQVMENGALRSGSAWMIPAAYYTPIRQDAVLLKASKNNPAAQAWMQYLRSNAAREIIHSFGYALTPPQQH